MIKILPEVSETLVVTHEWDVVLQRLNEATTQVEGLGNSSGILGGWIKDDRFQLMVRQRRPNSFMPLVDGRIDPTSNGCLIFLRYRLIPSTRMYLVAWTLITLVTGIFLGIHHNNIMLGVTSIVIIALIYGIAWANFIIHHRPLHDIIIRVLT